jgi:hypothetical protein
MLKKILTVFNFQHAYHSRSLGFRQEMHSGSAGAGRTGRLMASFAFLLLLFIHAEASAQSGKHLPGIIDPYVSTVHEAGYFTLSSAGKSAPLYVSTEDYSGVQKVMKDLQTDIKRVTNSEPQLFTEELPKAKEIVLAGTLGKSPLIDQLVAEGKLEVKDIAGRWESSLLQVVENPLPGVDRALVIAGSDKRGTIYGIYDLSAQIGVTPWYWWADVPVKQQENLYVMPGRHSQDEPAVKYRGIFINDEAPAYSGWTYEKFGGFNSKMYVHVFELILRMKGNYLWPAMWGNAFFDDDPRNGELADEYGVVIGTTHHEPLGRAHDEWRRYGEGPWNYETNEETLREFWRGGVERQKEYETIISLGMRGDGDEPMSEESNIALLERIVKDQREIIADVTGKPAAETPQLWALYKEVLDYYEKGMRVPDDVTLLLCDDNWGNVRKLPEPGEKPRAGGYGMYYHYDYVGGPRNYKWLNTNPIARVWEQMHLTYEHGVDRIWIVNVGDIKPMEFPIEFFMDYAWNPDKWPAERLQEYGQQWASRQFGPEYAAEIADFIARYTKFNSRRKPELISPETYSLVHYREAERIVEEYNQLAKEAENIYNRIPEEYRDAYYQLVLYPVVASANLNELHITVGQNRLYAAQGRAATNALAEKARLLFEKDAALSDYYNNEMADGKWSHMMDQTHISYTYWQQPEKDVMPEVEELELPAGAQMGVAIEGDSSWWPDESRQAVLPELNPFQTQDRYIEIFNRGQKAFDYRVKSGKSWLKVTPSRGTVSKEQRLELSVDWERAPSGVQQVPITVRGPRGQRVVVHATVNKPASLNRETVQGFVESNGYVSIEAHHYSNALETEEVKWQLIPDLGRTGSALTPFPVTAGRQEPGGDSPHLEYRINLLNSGEVKVRTFLSPTLSYYSKEGLRYAVSIDDEAPQIINMHGEGSGGWDEWVANNIINVVSTHKVPEPGEHVLKFWMVDPGVVLQKIVVETAERKPSYLGPPQSYYQPAKAVK